MLNATNRAALKYIIILYVIITLLMFFNTEKYRPDYPNTFPPAATANFLRPPAHTSYAIQK